MGGISAHAHFTLFLLTTDSTAQHELHQLAQFSDVSHLSYEVQVGQVLIRHLVTEHLLVGGKVG